MSTTRRLVMLALLGAALGAVVCLGGQDPVLLTAAASVWVFTVLICEGGHYLVRRADSQRQRLLAKRDLLRRLRRAER